MSETQKHRPAELAAREIGDAARARELAERERQVNEKFAQLKEERTQRYAEEARQLADEERRAAETRTAWGGASRSKDGQRVPRTPQQQEMRDRFVREKQQDINRIQKDRASALEMSRRGLESFARRLPKTTKRESVETTADTEVGVERAEQSPWSRLRFPDARYAMLALIAVSGVKAAGEVAQSFVASESDAELKHKIDALEVQLQAMREEAQIRERIPDARELLAHVNLPDMAPTIDELLDARTYQTSEYQEIVRQLEITTTEAGDVMYRYDSEKNGLRIFGDFNIAVHAKVVDDGRVEISLLGHVPKVEHVQNENGDWTNHWSIDQELWMEGVYVTSGTPERLLARHDLITEEITAEVAEIIQGYLDDQHN